jgi:hypothetical protein
VGFTEVTVGMFQYDRIQRALLLFVMERSSPTEVVCCERLASNATREQ